jgi:hypothetical protein
VIAIHDALAAIPHAQSRVAAIETEPRPPPAGNEEGWFVAVI